MIAMRRYIVFIISVTSIMSSPIKIRDADITPFNLKILALHNEYRSIHGVEHLKLNDDLSKDAKDILIKIFNNQSKLIPKDIGINTGDGKIDEVSDLNDEEAKRVFLKWYDTGAEYDYDNEVSKEVLKNAAPFTQIVWKKTKKIGITTAVKEDGTYKVVVTYSPLGNKNKHYKNNVIRPKTPE